MSRGNVVVFLRKIFLRFFSCMAPPHHNIVRKLKENSPLYPLGETGLRSLGVRTRRLQPDEDLIREGDHPEFSALVLEGMVARYHALANGRRQYLSFHLSGDLPDAQTLFFEKMDHAVCAVGGAQVALIAH